MSPLLWENGRSTVAYVSGASFLSLGFIGLPHKPSYSASFLHRIILLNYPHSITLYIFDEYLIVADAVSPLNNLDQLGLALAGMKLQYFGHLMQRVDSLEKTPML